MLTKEELLIRDTLPHISEISLNLYKEFSKEILFNRKFYYCFSDNTAINVEFREWGIYHMLAIQHINRRIRKNEFFELIDAGLELNSFETDLPMRKRYKEQKERITMFSCVYNALRTGFTFYVPSDVVPHTKSVKLDYIIFAQIDGKGLNIGLRKVGNVYVPITILISRAANPRKYIDETRFKYVDKLEIQDCDGNILESYTRTMSITIIKQESPQL